MGWWSTRGWNHPGTLKDIMSGCSGIIQLFYNNHDDFQIPGREMVHMMIHTLA